MTTEVQTVEPAEAPAVPAATPPCSADYAASAAARRLKRTGSSTNEAADMKRPRTAPATPIDPAVNGANPPVGKLTASDPDDVRNRAANPSENGARPSAAASAPAALTRALRSQPSVSTTPSVCGVGNSHGPASRHCGAISGVVAAPQQSQQQQQRQPEDAPEQQHQQQHQPSSVSLPLQLLPALHRAAAAGPAGEHCMVSTRTPTPNGGNGSGNSRHHTPHHDGHQLLHHHRHDALEEQVFSPAFHLPTSGSPTASHCADHSPAPHPVVVATATAAPSSSDPPAGGRLQSSRPGTQAPEDAPPAAAAGSEAEPVGVHSKHHDSPTYTQLHAIDLNVVDGVDVDTDDDELGNAGPASAAVAGLAEGCLEGAATRPPAAEHTSASISGGDIAAVGEELSSSSGGGGSGGGGEEEEDFYECSNDENAPMGGFGAAGWAAAPAPGSAAAQHRFYQQHRTGDAQEQRQPQAQPQQQSDTVLVASAPRPLAAAVSAAVPAAGTAAAAAGPPDVPADQEDDDDDDDDAFLEFDPLVFIKQLPPLETCVPPHRPALLPRLTRSMAGRKTLVLDLDETLVHSSLEAVERSDFSFPVVFNGMEHKVYVRQRPHLREFMSRVASLFEVVVFTASQRIYAERLLDILDPGQELVRHRIYRDSCVVVDGNYLKDLSILGRDLAHTVIVDNSPQAFGFQVDNGIPIESWYDDDSDLELLKLLPFLESLAAEEGADVRPRIRSQFRLRELIDRA